MAIDRSGDFWRGATAADLEEYLRAHAGGRARAAVARARCACGGERFGLAVDDHDDCAARTCAGCGAAHAMLDSAARWDDAQPEECQCPCGADVFEAAVGFAPADGGSAIRATLGLRCVACGVLGVYADWTIAGAATAELLARV